MARAFTFPGQGSQTVGMGRALADAFPAARLIFEEVDDALDIRLTRIMWEGPEADLTLTENAQPALMATSLAVIRVLESEAGLDLSRHARFLAGHSLGEYSALASGKALSVADTARLLRTRGQAMQAAVPVGVGAMAALLAIDIDDVATKVVPGAAGGQVCAIANDNAPGQVVISGHREAIEAALERAKEAGAKKGVLLPVSAPFHCPLMEPAAEAMAEALAAVPIQAPVVPIVANVTADAVGDPETIRTLLRDQITGRVRWRESILHMVDQGVEGIVEVGAGKVLTGMHKRIHRGLRCHAVETPADVDAFAKLL
ncbi:MAG: ACP S-malonyltransferase [Alphaproteobacteria bacterium]